MQEPRRSIQEQKKEFEKEIWLRWLCKSPCICRLYWCIFQKLSRRAWIFTPSAGPLRGCLSASCFMNIEYCLLEFTQLQLLSDLTFNFFTYRSILQLKGRRAIILVFLLILYPIPPWLVWEISNFRFLVETWLFTRDIKVNKRCKQQCLQEKRETLQWKNFVSV